MVKVHGPQSIVPSQNVYFLLKRYKSKLVLVQINPFNNYNSPWTFAHRQTYELLTINYLINAFSWDQKVLLFGITHSE